MKRIFDIASPWLAAALVLGLISLILVLGADMLRGKEH